jgi:hypothetical protein
VTLVSAAHSLGIQTRPLDKIDAVRDTAVLQATLLLLVPPVHDAARQIVHRLPLHDAVQDQNRALECLEPLLEGFGFGSPGAAHAAATALCEGDGLHTAVAQVTRGASFLRRLLRVPAQTLPLGNPEVVPNCELANL